MRDLKRPIPFPNAATFLNQAAPDLLAFSRALLGIENRIVRRGYKSIGEELKDYEAAMAAFPRILPLLQQASVCGDCNLELPYDKGIVALNSPELSEGMQRIRQCTNFLAARARLLRVAGKGDEAIDASLLNIRLARHIERDPLLITYLAAAACEDVAIAQINATLRNSTVSMSKLAELERELARDNQVQKFQRVLKSERAYVMSASAESVNWWNAAFWLVYQLKAP